MCNPAALTLVSTGMGILSAGSQYMAQNAQADAQEAYNSQLNKNAEAAYSNDINALRIQQRQDQQAASQKMVENQKEAMKAKASAKVSAGESGISGVSLDSLLGDFSRQEADYKNSVLDNLQARDLQRQSDYASASARLQSRNAGQQYVSRPSLFSTGLQIAGSTFNSAQEYYYYRNPPNSGETE